MTHYPTSWQNHSVARPRRLYMYVYVLYMASMNQVLHIRAVPLRWFARPRLRQSHLPSKLRMRIHCLQSALRFLTDFAPWMHLHLPPSSPVQVITGPSRERQHLVHTPGHDRSISQDCHRRRLLATKTRMHFTTCLRVRRARSSQRVRFVSHRLAAPALEELEK